MKIRLATHLELVGYMIKELSLGKEKISLLNKVTDVGNEARTTTIDRHTRECVISQLVVDYESSSNQDNYF